MTKWYRPIGDDGPPTKIKPNHEAIPINKDVLIETLIETIEELGHRHECCEIVEEAYRADLPGFRDLFNQHLVATLVEELRGMFGG